MRLFRQALLPNKATEAAGTIAALTGFAAVGVIDTHEKVRPVGTGLCHDQLITTNAVVTVRYPADHFRAECEGRADPVEHDEVVAQRVHFRERKRIHCIFEDQKFRGPGITLIIVR